MKLGQSLSLLLCCLLLFIAHKTSSGFELSTHAALSQRAIAVSNLNNFLMDVRAQPRVKAALIVVFPDFLTQE
jgi:hypothetical protein